MTSQTGSKTITIHILPDISRSECSKIMKFDQLIEYNIRIIFLEKFCTKYGGEAKFGGECNLRPFFKKLKLGISLDNSLKFRTVCFYCLTKSRATKIY